jgi:hypothetical protein
MNVTISISKDAVNFEMVVGNISAWHFDAGIAQETRQFVGVLTDLCYTVAA